MINEVTWKELIKREQYLVLTCAYDALSARLIQMAGFPAYVIGGFPLVGSRYGLPDIGLVGLGEMASGIQDIMKASSLPVLVDADTGYGDVKNVTYTIQTYEQMGASAILLEDQVLPKRCGHMEGKNVIPTEEMVRKLMAAAAARQNENMFIIARTDARHVYGLDEALRRCEAYIKAGADGIFVEAPESAEELEIIIRAFDVPQLCNMLVDGKTPILSNKELSDMGYVMIVHPITLIMRVARVIQESLKIIRADEQESKRNFVSFEEFEKIMKFDDWAAVENNFR